MQRATPTPVEGGQANWIVVEVRSQLVPGMELEFLDSKTVKLSQARQREGHSTYCWQLRCHQDRCGAWAGITGVELQVTSGKPESARLGHRAPLQARGGSLGNAHSHTRGRV